MKTKDLKWFSSILNKITDEIMEKTGCDINSAVPLAEVEIWKHREDIVKSCVHIYDQWQKEI